MARKRILLAKMGLDCHDTGIITVAAMLRDAGHEVIYLGLHNNAEQVVKTMIEEGVDAVGISFLSGQHMTQVRRLLDRMRAENVRAPVFCGGVIPADDAAELQALGVADVFTPGTLTRDVVARVDRCMTGVAA
jgi:methylmalonyl-CoA mutase C-terminal domain/subunit